MSVHCLKAIQTVPAGLKEAWEFFSSPDNLQVITPTYMRFRVISRHRPERIHTGQLIEYKIRPLLGIPLYWMTEITHVQEKQMFIDEQRFGPYRLWHHQHHFREVSGGTEITDIVHYKPPFWLLGDLAHTLFLQRQLDGLFQYRREKLEEIFGVFPVRG